MAVMPVMPVTLMMLDLAVIMPGALSMRVMVPLRGGMGTMPAPSLVQYRRPLDLLKRGMQHQGCPQRFQVGHG